MKKSIRLPYKILATFMALLIITISAPFVFAAEPVILTASNVTTWPTANGEIYYGQKISEGITLSGGEVQYEGAVVPGHFEFIDPEQRNSKGYTDLKFVPDDLTAYSVFEIANAWNVIFTINKTTPVLVDANNPPVATEVAAAGTLLGKSKISGGQVMNPYYPDDSTALGFTWSWVDRREPVTKSGYYEAKIGAGNYNSITTMIYVKIAGDVPETAIAEMPTIPELNYDPDITWADVPLTGGKAVINDNEEVSGTFAISDTWKDKAPEIGSYNVSVIFTPDDLTKASVYTMLIPVTVNKGPIRFVDENGNDIVPEITVEYGTKFNDISRLLLPYVKGAEYTLLSMGDLEYKQCEEGTYTITASAPSDGEHYEATELTFKIVIAKKKLNPKLYSTTGKLYINDNSAVYKPKGTFTLEYTIDGVEQTPITGIKYNTHFDWNPTKSGNYEYKIIYNEAEENEYFIIDDFTVSNPVRLSWAFSATGSLDRTYQYGSEVTLEAPATDPAKADKPYYGFVEWVDANGNTGLSEEELENREISFRMPDGEVELNATYKFDFCLFVRFIYQKVADWLTSFFQSIGTLF